MESEQDDASEARSEEDLTAPIDLSQLQKLLYQALPDEVTPQKPEITVHEDNLLIVLFIEAALPADITKEVRAQLERQIIQRRREETRRARVSIGRTIERDFTRSVSWGMQTGETRILFTNNTRPVMTRLSARERQVLDILVDTGIVRTHSAALSYIVRLFARDYQDWLQEARKALEQIDTARGSLQPRSRSGSPPPDTLEEGE